VQTLAETQAMFRQAVVTGELTAAAALLGARVEKRIAIHRRNYQSSLVAALLGKFPAVAWLAGIPFVTEAAQSFIEQFPPQKPCIAEYGKTFPEFLSTRPGARRVPYLEKFADLEWQIGHKTIAVPEPHIAIDSISSIDPEKLPELRLHLQHGVGYLHAAWPIDELMKLYVTDCAPDRLEFEPSEVFLEVRGSRGSFQINRLEESEFLFRKCLANSMSIGDAAEHVMDTHVRFDAGSALVRLIADELVTSIFETSDPGDVV
jgi:hypothetical protein